MKEAKTVSEKIDRKEDRAAMESGERKSVLAALKEKQEGLKRWENMANQLKGHKRKGQEL